MISPMSKEAKRAAKLLRMLRDKAVASSGWESDYSAWVAAYGVWVELVGEACDQCLAGYAVHDAKGLENVAPAHSVPVLCDACELARRASLGLCTHTLHKDPQPCSSERRCDECVSDGICHVCRRNEAPDMDRPCPECEVGRAEALMEDR